MKRIDKKLIVVIGCVFLICVIVFMWQLVQNSGTVVRVEQNGKLLYRLQLHQDIVIRIEGEAGYNQLEIQSGKAYVSEADCVGQDCVQFAPIDKPGQSIVCLPHKLYIIVEGE